MAGEAATLDVVKASDIALVPAGPANLPVMAALYVQMYTSHGAVTSPSDAQAKLTLMLDAPHQQGVLFRLSNQTLGFAIWADMGDHIFIRDYLIDAAHRRRGLGAALFARLRAEYLPQDRPLRLEASADHALAFWKAQGFHMWSSGMRTDLLQEQS